MTQTICKRIYGIVLSAVTVIAGLCLMAACWGIYRSGGEQTYTPQKVAEAFSSIAVPVYLCLVLVIGGWILEWFLPSPAGKRKAEKNPAFLLLRQRQRTDLTKADPALQTAILAQQNRRRLHLTISAVLLVIGSAVFLSYGLNGKNFDSVDITGSVIRGTTVLLLCLVIPFGYSVFAAYACRSGIEKEIALRKQLPAKTPDEPKKARVRWETAVRYGLLCLAVGLMVYGFVAGGWADVLTKAVNICTECVGLG